MARAKLGRFKDGPRLDAGGVRVKRVAVCLCMVVRPTSLFVTLTDSARGLGANLALFSTGDSVNAVSQ
jgi:hypothetical protein